MNLWQNAFFGGSMMSREMFHATSLFLYKHRVDMAFQTQWRHLSSDSLPSRATPLRMFSMSFSVICGGSFVEKLFQSWPDRLGATVQWIHIALSPEEPASFQVQVLSSFAIQSNTIQTIICHVVAAVGPLRC
ncbi:uncharacterized protein BDCG_16808 [Blastomyces dermatitidis ER-3]|uniref:Uncharacterized protein n=3 Tax=Blastomyces TaxID=229219 RepID=A0A179U8J5_BLAGS|nr:uncharacterized protein BDBG_16222 [Blastomyces gilchristii SLH14081]XP_031576108.1 hypothetical protein, variant [Blastomyces gilchristii SLH14081]XP_045280672.1 uncharacterized protein BDCG_16808 [Blastomyces dermatitidis ER-3]KMW69173.1 hypothetical protein BDDG_13338 [Blastomyces dermatitidis ATCC 18188]OAT00945.1 hypothetical protein BDCG_16808 [Blastomyces dermatitidis ER-3]OAT04315.1 hypothetical protein BDBG_16222 [Blastomyces gilchristii SLH14081]OAT04316.1 hypothetical protein, v